MSNYLHYDLQSLRLFIMVAELGSLTKAAERSSMTLSAASKRIAELERNTGCALLLRQPRGVALTPAGKGLLTDAQLLTLIRTIHAKFKGAYGSPRITEEVRSRGFPASKARVERLMSANGIRARHKRRYRVTTDSRHKLPVAPNVLNRQFTPAEPNQVFTSDITYIWTDEGWLYLAVTLDLFNREVVGWSVKPRMTAGLVTDALTMAWFRRRPAPGALHHSDRGSQYASHDFQRKLAFYGMRCSMSRKGNCWDNAPTESFFNSLKNERVHGTRYRTHREAVADLFEYIEVFYNRSRRHSSLGFMSPTQFMQDWLAAQRTKDTAA